MQSQVFVLVISLFAVVLQEVQVVAAPVQLLQVGSQAVQVPAMSVNFATQGQLALTNTLLILQVRQVMALLHVAQVEGQPEQVLLNPLSNLPAEQRQFPFTGVVPRVTSQVKHVVKAEQVVQL